MDYEETIKVINELEKIEEVIAPPRYRRCCYSFLEFCKAFFFVMCHPMETIYLRTGVKSEALKYAILVGALKTE